MNTTVWLNQITESTENQKNAFASKKDYLYLDVKMLLKIAKKSDILSKSCTICEENKKQIEYLTNNLAGFSETIAKRKEYDRKKDFIFQHLRKKHRMFPHNYFTSMHSLTGMLAGSGLGYLFSLLPFITSIRYSVIIGYIVGLAIGRIIGNKIDFKIKKENRTL